MEDRIKKLEAELKNSQNEAIYYKNFCEKLLEISRERSNKDRDLHPRRGHTGYVLLSEDIIEYKHDRGKNKPPHRLAAYRCNFQTPFNRKFSREQVERQTFEDLQDIFSKCGITTVVKKWTTPPGVYDAALEKAWAADSVAFSIRARFNGRADYWEITCITNKPIEIIPEILKSTLDR